MNTDLFEVIRRNSIRQVKLLLEAGYNVNGRSERMETPLMAGIMHVHDPDCRTGITKLLLSSGADINLQNGRGQTVLMYACILNQVETVLQLLQFNNLELNMTDTDGNTALMYASALGHIDIIKLILNSHTAGLHCVKLHKKNYDGMGALEHAAEGGHFDCVKLLSSFGRAASTKQEPIETLADVNWVEEIVPNTTPTGNKHQSLNEKVQQIIQEVQDACAEESDAVKDIPPSPCVGLPSPAVIITGAEQLEKKKTGKSQDGKNKKPKEQTTNNTPVAPRSPSRSRQNRSAAQQTTNGNSDEEPELSLASLGELVTTVRECAREIREICHLSENNREGKAKKSKKGKGLGKTNKTNVLGQSSDQTRRRGGASTPVVKERKLSHIVSGTEEALNHTWPQRSSSSLSARKSASNTTLNREVPSLKTTSPHGEIQDQSLLNEKQILDKVFCRLNNAQVIWGDENARGCNKQTELHGSNRSSKAAMLLRDQFSSYGNPLPGIQRPVVTLPPVRDGVRFRQLVHAQLGDHVQECPAREGDICGANDDSLF